MRRVDKNSSFLSHAHNHAHKKWAFSCGSVFTDTQPETVIIFYAKKKVLQSSPTHIVVFYKHLKCTRIKCSTIRKIGSLKWYYDLVIILVFLILLLLLYRFLNYTVDIANNLEIFISPTYNTYFRTNTHLTHISQFEVSAGTLRTLNTQSMT